MKKIDLFLKDHKEEIIEEASRYTLTNSMLNEIIDALKQSIIKNSNSIIDANKEDVKHNKKQIKIKALLNIIESYRNSECILKDDERKIVIYKGDPYLTLHICLQAITQRTKVLLIYQEFMLGVNEVLLHIINILLKDYKIENLIYQINKFSMKEINIIKDYYDEIIVIGDTTVYQMIDNAKFYPYNNIALYCDCEELEKLQEAIYIYASENEFELEIIYEETLGEAIDIINADTNTNIAILLTNDENSRKQFCEKIKNKTIFVNENPFKSEVGQIYNYLK